MLPASFPEGTPSSGKRKSIPQIYNIMKKNLFYAASLLLAAATFAGCSNEESEGLQQNAFSVEAGIGFQQSRTTLQDDDETVVWSKGDQIYLFGGNSNATMTLVEGEGETTATFRGGVNGFTSQLTHALYPVPAVSGNTYTYEFPAEIAYSENSNAPMLGSYTSGNVQFENLTAMVRIPLKNLDAGKENVVTLTMTGITGTATVNVEEGSLEFPQTGMGDEVTVTIPAGVTECFVDVPVPAKAYEGFSVELNGNVIASKTFETAEELGTTDVAVFTLGEVEGEDSELTPEEDGSYMISNAAELIQFAQEVNNGETFKDVTVKLGADIDLAGFDWKPIGNSSNTFKGVFDGQEHTILNLTVAVTEKASAGLFAECQGTVKNLTLQNVNISGNYKAGAFVGNGLCSKIENCHVNGGTITSTPYNKDDANNVGGIVGYLSAEPAAYVKDCSVTGLTITAYRDVAGIVGTATATSVEITNNKVSNTTIIADQTAEYSAVKPANAGKIAGRNLGGANLATDTFENVTVETLVATATQLQNALDNAVDGECIVFANTITGSNVTVTQKMDVKITIDGRSHQFTGAIIVNGGSKANRNGNAALSINNVNFRGGCDQPAYINLGKQGDNNTRYTNNVTVDGCTFEFDGSKDLVAVKSYTGGDWNLKINDCVVSAGMHSLVQVTNVEKGLEITGCKVYSKNGANLNSTPGLLMDKCTFDTKGYAVRFGVNGTVGGESKSFEIKNSTLKSACEDGDAVVIFRDNAKKATLILSNTTISGNLLYSGESDVTIEK